MIPFDFTPPAMNLQLHAAYFGWNDQMLDSAIRRMIEETPPDLRHLLIAKPLTARERANMRWKMKGNP